MKLLREFKYIWFAVNGNLAEHLNYIEKMFNLIKLDVPNPLPLLNFITLKTCSNSIQVCEYVQLLSSRLDVENWHLGGK